MKNTEKAEINVNANAHSFKKICGLYGVDSPRQQRQVAALAIHLSLHREHGGVPPMTREEWEERFVACLGPNHGIRREDAKGVMLAVSVVLFDS